MQLTCARPAIKSNLSEEKKPAKNFVGKKFCHWQNNSSLFTNDFFARLPENTN